MKKPLIVWNRRCLAVDMGQSRIKVILAERRGAGLEILHALTIDLQDEGLLTVEETNRHLRRLLADLGEYPVALALPQQLAPSHLISLPETGRVRWKNLIEEETRKLTGLSESSLVHGQVRLKPFSRHSHPIWVTVSREADLLEQLSRLGPEAEIGEVTNVAGALASAFAATQPAMERVALIDLGGTSTTIVILERMQPVFAVSLPMGGERLSEALANRRELSFDEAEVLKKTSFLLSGEERDEGFVGAVGQWRAEVERILLDWLKDQSTEERAMFPVRLSGGGAQQPGLLAHLNETSDFFYDSWLDKLGGVDPHSHAVAYGAALAGVKAAPLAPSLLPRSVRGEKRRLKQAGLLNTAASVLLVALAALLWWDTAAREANLEGKTHRLESLEEALAGLNQVEDLLERREIEYRRLRPFVTRRKNTRDFLQTLALMRTAREENDIWFLSFSDARSYFNEELNIPSPARPERREGGPGLLTPRARDDDGDEDEEDYGPQTGYILELAVLDEGRETHATLRNVVAVLRDSGLYRNVDTLPSTERRQLVDPELTLPGRTFALHLDPLPGPTRTGWLGNGQTVPEGAP